MAVKLITGLRAAETLAAFHRKQADKMLPGAGQDQVLVKPVRPAVLRESAKKDGFARWVESAQT
jgi:hypothetical protein